MTPAPRTAQQLQNEEGPASAPTPAGFFQLKTPTAQESIAMHDTTIGPAPAPAVSNKSETNPPEPQPDPDRPAGTDPQDAPETLEPAPKKRRINTWRERRQAERAARRAVRPPAADRSVWAILGVVALALLVLAIVGVGLYTGLGALRDTALAAHIEPGAARLWWIGIDGLIVVAIVAAMILRHDPAARRYALGIVALFTAASGLLQFLHGLGWTTRTTRSGDIGSLPWQVVAVIAVLVIGTIFCGTHLFVYTLRHLFPSAMGEQAEQPAADAQQVVADATEPRSSDSDTEDGPADNDRPEPPLLDSEMDREVRKWFAACAVHLILDAGGKPTRASIARSFGIADRQAGYVIADVIADREEAAERRAEEEASRAAGSSTAGGTATVNGSAVAS